MYKIIKIWEKNDFYLEFWPQWNYWQLSWSEGERCSQEIDIICICLCLNILYCKFDRRHGMNILVSDII